MGTASTRSALSTTPARPRHRATATSHSNTKRDPIRGRDINPGGLYAQTKRLTSVTTKYQAQNVRQYRLRYELSTTSGNSLLKGVEECGYDGAVAHCLPETVFDWYEAAPTYKLEPLQYINSGGQAVSIGESATVQGVLPKKDMNGDGTLDWSSVFINAEGEYKADNTYENLGSCQLNHQTWQTRCANADFNQDGLTDSWKVVNGVFQYAYANSSGSPLTLINTPITLSQSGLTNEEIIGITDLNGDGYVDVLVQRTVQTTSTHQGTADVQVFLHTKNHSAPYLAVGYIAYSVPARRLDPLHVGL